MDRRWLNALLFLVMGAFLLHLAIGPIKKQTVVTCEFVPQPEPALLGLATNSVSFGKIRVKGGLSGEFKHKLYHYDGTAVWTMDGRQVAGKAAGAIFLAPDRTVEAISLWIEHPAFGQENLTVATLNANGILDANRASAFLFADPREKLAHPARYACRSERNFDHIYQRLTSFNWFAAIAILAILWAVMFLARRKADDMEFGQR